MAVCTLLKKPPKIMQIFWRKSPTGSNVVRKIPINYYGKLEIPNSWIKHMPENKTHWRDRAVKEEQDRNAKANGTE